MSRIVFYFIEFSSTSWKGQLENFTFKHYALNGSQIKSFYIYNFFFYNRHIFIKKYNPKYAYYTKVDVQLFFDFPKIQKVQNHGQVSPNSNIIEMISTFICFVVNVLNNWNLLELDIHSHTHTHTHTHISSSLANVSLFCKINFDNLAFDPFFFFFFF